MKMKNLKPGSYNLFGRRMIGEANNFEFSVTGLASQKPVGIFAKETKK
jgi:hypothetical protein